jgi:hypothetical protein
MTREIEDMSFPQSCRSIITLLGVLGSSTLASGCVAGLLYEDVGHPPVQITGHPDSVGAAYDPNLNASMGGRQLVKKGVACAQDVLKLVAWGDATQAAAAKQGGITEVVGVDFDTTAVLAFFYTKSCTVVYGTAGPPPELEMTPAAPAPDSGSEPPAAPPPAQTPVQQPATGNAEAAPPATTAGAPETGAAPAATAPPATEPAVPTSPATAIPTAPPDGKN